MLVFKPGRTLLIPAWGRPRIDWTHPLANGLISCFVPGVAAGVDPTSTVGDLTADTSVVLGVSQEGPALVTTVVHGGLYKTGGLPSSITGYNQLSLYWRGYPLGNQNTYTLWFGVEYSNTNSNPYHIASITSPGPTTVWLEWNSGGSYSHLGGGYVYSSGVNRLAGTFKVGGNASLYINGVLQEAKSFGASPPTADASATLCLQSAPPNTDRPNNAACFLSLIYNRELSAAEVAALDADPYGFLIWDEQEWPTLSAGSPFTWLEMTEEANRLPKAYWMREARPHDGR